jgi:hypothetical protein
VCGEALWLRPKHGVVWRSRVAGEDTLLVSKSATLLAFTATLFYYYDSLIEKCSTLSRLCAAQGWSAFFSPKLSV